jgi:hypothetical protein
MKQALVPAVQRMDFLGLVPYGVDSVARWNVNVMQSVATPK